MKSTTRKSAAAKIVTVIARYFIKRNGHVVYACRGSHGETYCTTVINGKATGCTCPARTTCKHMKHCQELEAARPVAAPVVTIGQVMAEANEAMSAHINTSTNDYDLLATSKSPVSQRFAYGSCSHLVKPEHEGDLCGACMSKLLFG